MALARVHTDGRGRNRHEGKRPLNLQLGGEGLSADPPARDAASRSPGRVPQATCVAGCCTSRRRRGRAVAWGGRGWGFAGKDCGGQ